MDTKSALSTAGALVLVVAGGASALAAARLAPAATSTSQDGVTTITTIVTEYVDPDGNPVAAPGTEPSVEIRSLELDGEVIVVEAIAPEIIWVDAAATALPDAAGQEYEDDDHEEDDHDDEDEDDHEDDDHEESDDDD